MSVSFSPSAALCLLFSRSICLFPFGSGIIAREAIGEMRVRRSFCTILLDAICIFERHVSRLLSPTRCPSLSPFSLLVPSRDSSSCLSLLPRLPPPPAVVSSLLSAYSPIVFDNFSTAVRLMPMRSANLSVRFMQRRVAYVYINIHTYTRAVRRALYAPARTTGHYVDASEHI